MNTAEWLGVLTQAAVGIALLRAGLLKAARPRDAHLVEAVQEYELVPTALVPAIAAVLPWLEIVVGTALMVGLWPTVAIAVAWLLLTGFTVAVAWSVLRGRSHGCGCDGGSDPVSWSRVRNNIVLGAGLLVAFATGRGGWELAANSAGDRALLVAVLLGIAITVRMVRLRTRALPTAQGGSVAHV